MDLGFSGLDSNERPNFVKAFGVLGLPIDIFGLKFELEPRPSSCG